MNVDFMVSCLQFRSGFSTWHPGYRDIGETRDRPDAQLAHHVLQLVHQDGSGMLSTTLAECSDCVKERAAQHDEVGTGGNRLGDIQTGPYAAVYDQRHLAADDGADMGKLMQWVGSGIKLATAMVRDHQPVDAGAHSPLGILSV